MGAAAAANSGVISSKRDSIVADWSGIASTATSAVGLSLDEIVDSMPEFVDALVDVLVGRSDGSELARIVDAHVVTRLRQGYHLSEIVNEYTALGECIGRLLWRGERDDPKLVERVFAVLATSIGTAIATHERHIAGEDQDEKRCLRQLDALMQAAEDGAAATAQASAAARLIQSTLAVDAVTILVCEGDNTLALVGASGLLESIVGARVKASDTEFAARVLAAKDSGVVLEEFRVEKLVPAVRECGVRAMLGHPLRARGEVLGALYVGKNTAGAFTPSQHRLVRAIAARLGLLIDNLELVRRLRLSLRDLQREEQARDRFVAILAHDLRAPISAAKLSVGVLCRSLDGPQAVTAARVLRTLDRTDRMIRDLLDVQRVCAGNPLPLCLGEHEVAALICDVKDDLEQAFGPRFVLDLAPSAAAARCKWDADELRRALWNLGANAVKYGAVGAPVTFGAVRDGDAIVLSVHNRGAPLPPERLAEIFEPFGRAGESAQKTGWGLGLTLVRAAAEAHGGHVRVVSDASHGTTFSMWLPTVARS